MRKRGIKKEGPGGGTVLRERINLLCQIYEKTHNVLVKKYIIKRRSNCEISKHRVDELGLDQVGKKGISWREKVQTAIMPYLLGGKKGRNEKKAWKVS